MAFPGCQHEVKMEVHLIIHIHVHVGAHAHTQTHIHKATCSTAILEALFLPFLKERWVKNGALNTGGTTSLPVMST